MLRFKLKQRHEANSDDIHAVARPMFSFPFIGLRMDWYSSGMNNLNR